MLKRLAVEEQTAVCTVIHQPSNSIFSLLDHLLLIANGTLVYSGAPGAAVGLYQSFGYNFSDPSMNSADWLLDVAQGDVPNDRLGTSDPEQIMQDWRLHERTTARRPCFENVNSEGGPPRAGSSGRSRWRMYKTVLTRECVLLWHREPAIVLVATMIVGLLAGLIRRLSSDQLQRVPAVSCRGGPGPTTAPSD
jgi:hypothetical protein